MRNWLIAAVLLGLLATARFDIAALMGEATPRQSPAATTLQAGASAQQAELEKTLALIQRNGPFPHDRDGMVFQNRERLLPARPRGYYREYTVRTPGLSHRGPRRIVTGGNPPEVFYYTEDHYQSFQLLALP